MVEPVFFDRSFVDSAFMIKEADPNYLNEIKTLLGNHRYNNKVFIMPPWKEIYRTDNERDQSYEESIVVYQKLFNWYLLNGYELLIVPKIPVEARMEWLLANTSWMS